ncbi:hypothetical protein [Mameliella sediminis]|uniref:hypothetical protein n=1 Tax=Mameliella sediminis TaxID=2836866 RepID=UPI001C44A3CC|nr:hypothetical protein [Mameliella sediminis]MBV7396231.1 hypothetical protein [Mameliella sediminis]
MTETCKTLPDRANRYWRRANLTTGALLLGFCLLQLAGTDSVRQTLTAFAPAPAGGTQ